MEIEETSDWCRADGHVGASPSKGIRVSGVFVCVECVLGVLGVHEELKVLERENAKLTERIGELEAEIS